MHYIENPMQEIEALHYSSMSQQLPVTSWVLPLLVVGAIIRSEIQMGCVGLCGYQEAARI